MEFSIKQKILLECLAHFQSVVEKRNTIPILSNIKITALEGGLTLTATDLVMELSESLGASVKTVGGVTISSQLFFEIIRKAPDNAEVTLKVDQKTGSVFVLFGESKFSLPTLPVDDFPVMDAQKLEVSIELESDEFKNLIGNSKFCMGLDESRQYLNGIYLHSSENAISTVATDGHRLAKCTINKSQIQSFEGIIIPKKTVLEVSKIAEDFDEKVSLSFSKTRIRFIFGNLVIVSKLVNASFPDYESVIPKDNNQIMTVDCRSFSQTIDRVSTISDEKFRTVKFSISGNNCVVSSFGNDKSIGTENVNVDFQGSEISINFNAKYILDVLNIIKNGKVKFHFSQQTAPTILQSDTLNNSLFLIMQMRA